jgi:hypothetical protein
VKAVVVFLVGLTISFTGAFIRSCSTVPAELFNAWCGGPPQSFAAASHQHCAGCALVVCGLGLIAIAPTLMSWTSRRPMRVAAR